MKHSTDKPETIAEMLERWDTERHARREDEARAQRAGLGVDPQFIAQRERVARTEWIGGE